MVPAPKAPRSPGARTASAPPETAAPTSSTAIDATVASGFLWAPPPDPLLEFAEEPPPFCSRWVKVTQTAVLCDASGRTRCHTERGTGMSLTQASQLSAKFVGRPGVVAKISAMVGKRAPARRWRRWTGPNGRGRTATDTGKVMSGADGMTGYGGGCADDRAASPPHRWRAIRAGGDGRRS